MGISVGIDLGTTYSAVAKINENTGKPEVIKNSFDSPITPSVLCFEENGNILFGEDAKNMQGIGNTNAVACFKRNMGYEMFRVEIYGKQYSATDLSAIFLSKIVKEAETCCGEKIDSAVITVPAYFAHKERQATIDAGKRAGLNVLAVINEPTAAAFAYGLIDREKEQTVLIYDLGGGTFDVTIAKISKNNIDILGSDGNHELGGKDWDDCIARYLAQEFKEQYDLDLSEDDDMVASLLVTAENVKKQLTSRDKVNVPLIYKDIRTNITITEALFEEISSFLLGATKELTNNLLEAIGLTWADISGTILVGGSTRMRMIHNYVTEISGKEPLSGVNVDEAVALGAAIKANIDENGKTIHTGFLGLLDGKNCKDIAGAKKVSDVTAHALGMIAVSEDGERYINSIIIPKNTTIPAISKKQYNFQTRVKDSELEVYVLQGSYQRPLDNTIIDKYVITKIEKTSKNPSRIEVLYKYTSNGVVDVSAVQTETKKTLPIRIEKIPDDMSWTDGSPKDQMSHMAAEVEVMLAIDLSGSMSGEPVQKAQEAMRDFVSQMDANSVKIGIVAFADQTKLVTEPTSDYRKVLTDIENMEVGDVGICTGAEPFTITFETMYGRPGVQNTDKIRYLVVLTDGVWDKPKTAIREAEKCHKQGMEVIALGFGEADEAFLKQIASTEDFASLTNLAELSGSFSKIAQAIGEKSTGLSMI